MTDDLLARHRAVLPSWVTPLYAEPIELAAGKGCRVVDGSGKSYLDFFGGVLTTSLGYDAAEVREAVERQLATGVAHSSTLYLIRQQVTLAEKIARVSGIADPKVFLANSGTEANECAIKLARRSVDQFVNTVDIAPTLTHYCRFPSADSASFQGRSLLLLVQSRAPGASRGLGLRAGFPPSPGEVFLGRRDRRDKRVRLNPALT